MFDKDQDDSSLNCLDETTVKILNFLTPNKVAVIILKFEESFHNTEIFSKDVDGMVNSEDPDQIAPLACALSAYTCLSKKLGSLPYYFSTLPKL